MSQSNGNLVDDLTKGGTVPFVSGGSWASSNPNFDISDPAIEKTRASSMNVGETAEVTYTVQLPCGSKTYRNTYTKVGCSAQVLGATFVPQTGTTVIDYNISCPISQNIMVSWNDEQGNSGSMNVNLGDPIGLSLPSGNWQVSIESGDGTDQNRCVSPWFSFIVP